MEPEQILNNLETELRRGNLTLCVLSQLETAQYGYSLLQLLAEKGIDIEANTLYPLLRRLETQGLLESSWDTTETRPRKFYKLNDNGKSLLESLRKTWFEQANLMNKLLMEEHHD